MNEAIRDEDLMKRYQQGDAEAFEELYARYRKPLFNYLYRQTNQPQSIAEDLYQDIWLNLIRASKRYKETAGFKTYLYRIARNRLIDHYRLAANQVDWASETETEAIPDQAPLALPDDQAQFEETCDRFSEALTALPLEQQEVIVMKQNGLTLAEMAEVTNTRAETVKSRLRYAINKLRAALSDLNDEESS